MTAKVDHQAARVAKKVLKNLGGLAGDAEYGDGGVFLDRTTVMGDDELGDLICSINDLAELARTLLALLSEREADRAGRKALAERMRTRTVMRSMIRNEEAHAWADELDPREG